MIRTLSHWLANLIDRIQMNKYPKQEYVKFTINDHVKFRKLVAIFEQLKADKDQGEIGNEDQYLPFFDNQERSYFWWPSDEEIKDWKEQWDSAPSATRTSDPKLKRPLLFDAMISAFADGEYELINCRSDDGTIGLLEFKSMAYPYGGTGCMQALIECFGFSVVEVFDGSQPPYKVK